MGLTPRQRLGPYEVLAPLGAGGMGEVYRARDPRLGREVAIKVLPASYSADADRLKRFALEARAAGILNHPNITIVYDVGEEGGVAYVVQELLEGETLRGELAGGRLSSRRAVDYATQIAHGLGAAHEKGIVHRDLKPENVFVTRDGRVKILDFGLAKLTRVEGEAGASNVPTATAPGIVMGTPAYLSPEQIRAEPTDGRSDIFALGVILYEMLSGQRPFRGNSTAETMAAILKEEPAQLTAGNRSFSPELERLVRHCLEKSPERRFQSARDLAYHLETVSGVSEAAVATGASAALRRGWRRKLLAAALLAIGLLAGWVGANAIRQAPPDPSYTRLTFRRGTVFGARFAPDGQTVVYTAAWEGQPPRIFATRTGSVESRSLPLPAARVLAVSSTGELAIQLGRAMLWSSIGTLARVPLDGGAPRELLEDVFLADWPPDGRELAVVHRVSGRYRLEFPIGKVLFETAEPIESIRFSPGGDRIAVSHGGTITIVDPSGKATTVLKEWGSIGNVAWKQDGREIWFGGQRGADKFAVYAVTPSGRVRTVRREAGGLYFHDISRDGRVLLNGYSMHSSVVALPAGESAERELSWLDGSAVCAISADGRTVIINEWGEGGGGGGAVYLRHTDGSAAVRLGEGTGLALSADGRFVLARLPDPPDRMVLLPTGPGQPRSLPHRDVTVEGPFASGRILPGGKRAVFVGRALAQSPRVYVQDLDGGEPGAISPEGILPGDLAVSPDGRFVATRGADATIAVYPVDGGAERRIASEAFESPILWSSDGRSLYVYKVVEAPAQVVKLDIASGRRAPWKTIAPVDRSGLVAISRIVMTPDARGYAYSYERILTSLEVVDHLR